LKFFGSSAYLNPGNLSGDLQQFRGFIDSAFVKIKERKSRNLIVDLRNNQGGDDPFGDYLVSYFANTPFRWSSDFTLKTSALLKEDTRQQRDTTKAFWQQVLSHENGKIYAYPFDPYQPQTEEKRFGGTVYVLVNRQSHSQSTVTAAQIQDYGFGTIVGEETGEYPSLYASVFRYELPATGVSVQVSKGRMIRVNGSSKEQGVIPDIFIRDHLLDETDEILDGLLQQLKTD
jgi:C-terminal processing protease CtpA/Prc